MRRQEYNPSHVMAYLAVDFPIPGWVKCRDRVETVNMTRVVGALIDMADDPNSLIGLSRPTATGI